MYKCLFCDCLLLIISHILRLVNFERCFNQTKVLSLTKWGWTSLNLQRFLSWKRRWRYPLSGNYSLLSLCFLVLNLFFWLKIFWLNISMRGTDIKKLRCYFLSLTSGCVFFYCFLWKLQGKKNTTLLLGPLGFRPFTNYDAETRLRVKLYHAARNRKLAREARSLPSLDEIEVSFGHFLNKWKSKIVFYTGF